MKIIRILFYKAGRDGRWLDDAIAIWTGLNPRNWGTPRYSHVELQFIDRGVCFSSATRGQWTGCRFAPASEVLKHKDRWDYIDKAVSSEEEARLFQAAQSIVGCLYDFFGLFFGYMTFFRFEAEDRFYCSKSIDYILDRAWIFPKRHNPISPRRLASICAKQFKIGPMPLKYVI